MAYRRRHLPLSWQGMNLPNQHHQRQIMIRSWTWTVEEDRPATPPIGEPQLARHLPHGAQRISASEKCFFLFLVLVLLNYSFPWQQWSWQQSSVHKSSVQFVLIELNSWYLWSCLISIFILSPSYVTIENCFQKISAVFDTLHQMPPPVISKLTKGHVKKRASSWIVFQTEYWSALLSNSTILISHLHQTLSTLQGSHQGVLQYVGNPLMHWHQLQADVSHQLCKVRVLCNSSSHAHTFCHWSCSVTSWFRPRFQQRKAFLLADTKQTQLLRGFWLVGTLAHASFPSFLLVVSSSPCASAAYYAARQSKVNWRRKSRP